MERRKRPAGRRLAAALGLVLVVVSVAGGAAAPNDEESVTIALRARSGALSGGRRWDPSGVTGTATLTARGDRTRVELVVEGAPGEHPDHIHRSTCANPEPNPLYPLSDVVLNTPDERGSSVTMVDVPLAELLDGEYLILIHKSEEDLNVYLACGDIVAGDSTAMPVTGVGPAPHRSDRVLTGGLGLAAALALAALAMRHRASRI